MELLEEIAELGGKWYIKVRDSKKIRRCLSYLGDSLLKVIDLDINLAKINNEIGLKKLDKSKLLRKTHEHIHTNKYLSSLAIEWGICKEYPNSNSTR